MVAAAASPDSFTTASQVLPALRSVSRPWAFACAVATSVALATVSPALRTGAIAISNACRLSLVVASVVIWAVTSASVAVSPRLAASWRRSSVSISSSSAAVVICWRCCVMYWITCWPCEAEMWLACTASRVRDSASSSLNVSIFTRSRSWSLVIEAPFTLATGARWSPIQLAAPAPTRRSTATTTMRPKPMFM